LSSAARTRDGNTAERILDVAEQLVQERGFNAFSYADIAAELGITKAALHYHFASKAELGQALIDRYAARFAGALTDIDAAGGDAPARLHAYADLYLNVLRDQRMCLCGMLAAEYRTLPEAVRSTLLEFFDDNEGWLAEVLESGRSTGQLAFTGPARDVARVVVASLEGAMLIARPYGDLGRFQVAATQLLAGLVAKASSPS